MAQIISAFMGRSFQEDEPLWKATEKYLNSLSEIGFTWEDAERAQLKPISDYEIETGFGLYGAIPAFTEEAKRYKKKILFSGTLINKGLRYSIKSTSEPHRPLSILTGLSTQDEISGLAFISDDYKTITCVVDKEEKCEIFTCKKKAG